MSGLDLIPCWRFISFSFSNRIFFFSSSLSTSNTKLSFWNIYLIVISEIDFLFCIFFYFFQSCFDRPNCAPTIDRNPDLGKYKGQSQSRWSHLVMGARLYCSGKQFSTKVQLFLIALLNSLTLASQHILLFSLLVFISFLCDSFRSWRRWEWGGWGGHYEQQSLWGVPNQFSYLCLISPRLPWLSFWNYPAKWKASNSSMEFFNFFPFFLYFFPGFGRRKIFMSRHVDRTVWRVVQ